MNGGSNATANRTRQNKVEYLNRNSFWPPEYQVFYTHTGRSGACVNITRARSSRIIATGFSRAVALKRALGRCQFVQIQTQQELIGLGREIGCPRACSGSGRQMVPPVVPGRSGELPPYAWHRPA